MARGRGGAGLLAVSFSLFSAVFARAQETEPKVVPPEPVPRKSTEGFLSSIPIHGYVSARYRARWNWGDSDSDFYQYLVATAGDPLRHPVTGHCSLRFSEDLDGRASPGEFSPFRDITDTYSSNFNQRVYHLYGDVHHVEVLERIRLGRQSLRDAPVTVYLDGVSAETRVFRDLLDLKAGVYGGIPVHPFESSPSGDLSVGTWARANPWKGAQVRLDFLKSRDDYLSEKSVNDFFSAAYSQAFGPSLEFHYAFGVLDQEARDQRLRVRYADVSTDLLVAMTFHQLFETQRMHTQEFDQFFQAAGDTHPYWQLGLLASKGFGEDLTLLAGMELRRLEDSSDEGRYNREFQRVYLTPSLQNAILEGLSLSVTLERWDVLKTDEGDVFSLGFDATRQFGKFITASVGTDYSGYKFDDITGDERQGVRSIYLRLGWKVRSDLRIAGSFSNEHSRYAGDDNLDDINTLKVETTWTF